MRLPTASALQRLRRRTLLGVALATAAVGVSAQA